MNLQKFEMVLLVQHGGTGTQCKEYYTLPHFPININSYENVTSSLVAYTCIYEQLRMM